MSPHDRAGERIDQYVTVHSLRAVLCGLPGARNRTTTFTGPAALAKLYRFLADSRERPRRQDAGAGRLRRTALWGCRTIMKCVEACPKEVRPADGIRGVRRQTVLREDEASARGAAG